MVGNAERCFKQLTAEPIGSIVPCLVGGPVTNSRDLILCAVHDPQQGWIVGEHGQIPAMQGIIGWKRPAQ